MSRRNYLRQGDPDRIVKETATQQKKDVECIDYPSYVIDKGIIKSKITCEVNIAVLADTLKPNEESIITITPKANRAIKKIVASYVMMDVTDINRDLIFTMIGFHKGDKSFKVFFKNNSNREHKLRIYYHVLF